MLALFVGGHQVTQFLSPQVARTHGFWVTGALGNYRSSLFFVLRNKGRESKLLLDRWRAQWTPQLHVWPKILCKALVKVGFPPGEAMARSMVVEGE